MLRLCVGQLCRHRLKRNGQRPKRLGTGCLTNLFQQRSERLLRLCLGQLCRHRLKRPG
jgi:hypothetical protein